MISIQTASFRLTLCSLLIVSIPAMPFAVAEESSSVPSSGFGSAWEARPLVNTTGAPTVTSVKPAAQTPDANRIDAQKIEEMLEPVEPFIAGVEENLGVTLAENRPMRLERLNHIQDILFGERIYDDAGDLLARLAEIFPQEAAKAQATLQARLKETVQNPDFDPSDFEKKKASADNPKRRNKKSRAKRNDDHTPDFGPVATPTLAPSTFSTPSQAYAGTPVYQGYGQQQGAQGAYNEDYAKRAQHGETLKSLGRGLMNLAMIGGSLAGAYYLNKNVGGSSNAYNTPYGYSPYGTPYGYSPYGYGGYNMMPGYSPYTTNLAPARVYTTNGYTPGNYTYRTASPYANYGYSPYGYGYPYGGYNSGLGSLLNSLF